MTELTSNHFSQKVVMVAHNPFIEYYENQALGKQQQIGHGFYTSLPWQKSYVIGGLLGSIVRQFVPLLKPLPKAVGKRLLRAGTLFVSDIIDRKPIGAATRISLKQITEIRNKKATSRRTTHHFIETSAAQTRYFFIITEGITNVLDLFSKPRIQTSIIEGSWVEVRPTSSLDDDSAIEFEITGSGTDFLDLANTFIKGKVHITTPNGDDGFLEACLLKLK